MYQELLGEAAFYPLLLRFDEDLAAAERPLGCVQCGQRLHVSDYMRKPRGVPPGLGERYRERLSFCCADRQCRKRRTPRSVRFLARKVYLGTVVVLIAALRGGPTPARLRTLEEQIGVSRRTIERWRGWWTEALPASPFWRAASGQFLPPLEPGALPGALLERFAGAAVERLLACLRFLAPITTGSAAVHAA